MKRSFRVLGMGLIILQGVLINNFLSSRQTPSIPPVFPQSIGLLSRSINQVTRAVENCSPLVESMEPGFKYSGGGGDCLISPGPDCSCSLRAQTARKNPVCGDTDIFRSSYYPNKDGPPGGVPAALIFLAFLVVLSLSNLPAEAVRAIFCPLTRLNLKPGFSFGAYEL